MLRPMPSTCSGSAHPRLELACGWRKPHPSTAGGPRGTAGAARRWVAEYARAGLRAHCAQRNVRLKKSTVRCHANVAAASS